MGAFKVYNQTTSQWEYAKVQPANSTLVNGATLTGTVDGVNATFTTPTPFVFINIYKNGVRMRSGASNDYITSGSNTVIFNTPPALGSTITADYGTQQEQMINGSNSTITGEWSVQNGDLKTFTTDRPYIAGTLEVFVNGLRLGSGFHFFETNPATGVFTLDEAILATDNLCVNYQTVVSTAGNADTVDGYHFRGIMDKVNPVGTIYSNKTNATNPATLFDMPWSTWVALPGRVIVGKAASGTFGTAGGTMGTETETLSISQVPNVSGSIGLHGGENGSFFVNVGGAFSAPNGYTGQYKAPPGSTAGSQSVLNSIVFNNGGGGGSHNNIQPSLVAYMWERTA